jgi:serine protease AprX
LTGSGVKVCILDTGLQADQEQFTGAAGRQVTFVDLVGDYFGNIRTIPYDDHGHGTHVAGIVGGDGTPGDGEGADSTIAPLARGVAPAVHIHAVKVLNYNGSGPDSGIIAGVQECLTAGAHVANLSLGIPGSSDGRDALSQAVDAAVDAGMVVVVAAGNAGDGPQTIGSPGAAVKAITVGAVAEHTASTIADATSLGVYAAPFSSRGPTLDGRTKPDISAPGVSILSAMSNVVAVDPDPIWGGGGEVTLGCGEGCYTVSSGTSMASPFVAGAVALMLEADGSLTTDSAMVRQILADTAQDRGTVGMDNVFGHGLIDVQAAVSRAANAGAKTTSFPHHVFQQGTVPDGISVRVPVGVIDMTKPLAITVAIEGRLTRRGWSPDLDVILLDANRQPFMVNNPLYPWLSDDPTVPAPGTSSTCPAGEDCGQMGTQETIHIQPDTLQPGNPLFFVEIYPFAERPNNGKGGNYTIGLSNGYFAGPIDGPADNQLVARAGSDVTVIDDDDDGSADVTLDGRASLGMINEYLWSGTAGAESTAVATVRLPIGTHTFSLSVTNTVTGAMDTDSMTVTVTGSSSDGGEKGGGKRCNPKREVCD